VNSFVTGATFVHGRSRSPKWAVIPMRRGCLRLVGWGHVVRRLRLRSGPEQYSRTSSSLKDQLLRHAWQRMSKIGLLQLRSVNRALERVPGMP
jgi:hypothetical protein